MLSVKKEHVTQSNNLGRWYAFNSFLDNNVFYGAEECDIIDNAYD